MSITSRLRSANVKVELPNTFTYSIYFVMFQHVAFIAMQDA